MPFTFRKRATILHKSSIVSRNSKCLTDVTNKVDDGNVGCISLACTPSFNGINPVWFIAINGYISGRLDEILHQQVP